MIRRTVSFQVKLKKVEECAGNERAQNKATSTLNDGLQRDNQPHGSCCGGLSAFGFSDTMGLGHGFGGHAGAKSLGSSVRA